MQRTAVAALSLAGLLFAGPARALRLEDQPLAAGLADLSLEQLANVRVTSVTRRAESLSDAAAAVYVITSEDLRRAGAQTLPEALRLAPTLEVARADANQWAISARGFDSVLANKMLVLIDGRTVYSPLFSGTFWEAQDVLLDDVDRIEVISGPGGTTWGTNAVDGVINVITRSAADTRGALVAAGGGSERRVGEARWGGRAGEGLAWRGWVKYTDQDPSERADESHVVDASHRVHGGFRADGTRGAAHFHIEGGASSTRIEQVPDRRELSEFHLLGRWERQPRPEQMLRLEAYWDRTNRDQTGALRDALDTFEVGLQHGFRPLAHHDVSWGGGFRYQWDSVTNLAPAAFELIPDDRALRTGDAFVEDAVTLASRLKFTAGVKAEHNVWTHLEWLPTARLAWKPAASHLAWAAVSRAVRAPSRLDREFYSPGSPPHFLLDGGPGFVSELSTVSELGWRGQPTRDVSASVTAFYAHEDRLRSIAPTPDGPQFANALNGQSWGVEAWAKWSVTDRWRLSAGAVDQRRDVWIDRGATDLGGQAALGNDPNYWWSLTSAADVGPRLELDATLRQVGPLPSPAVPRYTTVDARVGVELGHGLDLSVAGANLLDAHHAEWGPVPSRAVFERSWFAQLRVR